MRVLLALLLVACAAESTPSEPPPECPLHDALLAELEPVRAELEAPGAVLAVDSVKSGRCAASSGTANVAAGTAMTPDHIFGVASLTKTFTAAVVLQLRDEGALSLDDPLSLYYADVAYADEVTIEQLLRHTSGIPDIFDYVELTTDLERPWSPEELVALTDAPLADPPGTRWLYSNTNYILLGLVIEAATQHSWETEVRTRLLDPLALTHTFLPTVEIPPGAGAVARGYFGSLDSTDTIDPSIGWSAGSMLSNADDLLRWLDALFEGDILSAETVAEMSTPSMTTTGITPYGLGIYVYEGGTKRGHDGEALFYQTLAFHSPSGAVVALINAGYKDLPLLADAGWQVLAAE